MQYTYREYSGHTEIIEAESMEDAVAQAEDLLREGDWGPVEDFIGCSVSAWVYGPDDEQELAQVDLMPEDFIICSVSAQEPAQVDLTHIDDAPRSPGTANPSRSGSPAPAAHRRKS